MKGFKKVRAPGKKTVVVNDDLVTVVNELQLEIDHLIARVVELERNVHALSTTRA